MLPNLSSQCPPSLSMLPISVCALHLFQRSPVSDHVVCALPGRASLFHTLPPSPIHAPFPDFTPRLSHWPPIADHVLCALSNCASLSLTAPFSDFAPPLSVPPNFCRPPLSIPLCIIKIHISNINIFVFLLSTSLKVLGGGGATFC